MGPGSLLLRKFCDENKIEYEFGKKFKVASKNQKLIAFDNLYLKRKKKNGVDGLQLVDESKINELEPYVKGVKGLWSPNTGIVDYVKLTEAYAKIFESKDGQI
ncbi:MAG: hypothetical protein CM1200mP33_5840 [Chloroflexota bacterium]|nr:MAG: hypothetical protein CM1200mP33_5840 [Chloroflexota bacterium]